MSPLCGPSTQVVCVKSTKIFSFRLLAFSVLLLAPPVEVLEADDVVLAQVWAALDLNHLDGDLAGVGHAVFAAQGDVGALVLAHQLLNAVLLDDGGALHHDPVFRPVVMHLQ